MEISAVMTVIFVIVLSILILHLGVRAFWMRRYLPPGPTPLPFLGNVLEVGNGDIVNSLIKLSKKYGEMFTVYLGSCPMVVVNGYKLVKEVYLDKGDHFLNRGDMPSWDEFFKNSGIVFTNNITEWKDLRKFSVSTLREMGFGKRNLEHMIHEEVQNLVSKLRKTKESFIDPQKLLSRASCKIIFSILFGNRHDTEKKDIDMVLTSSRETFMTFSSSWGQNAANEVMSAGTTNNLIFDMFPGILKHIPGYHQKMFWALERLGHYIEERVQMNKKTLDLDNPRNYVDAFLIKIEQENENPHSSFCMRNLLASASQIVFAGTQSVSVSMAYSLLVLVKHPDVLAKVQKEIEQVIGRDRSPTLQDRNDMPYTEAVLHELQRFIDIIPMGGVRRTTTDVTLNGYTLPKDTNVIIMLTSVLKDPYCFKYPTEFNPENFLNEKGEFQKNGAFMPLAAGKRMCLGEVLVRMELFLLLITLLQNFGLKSPVPLDELDITLTVCGTACFPKPYKIAFIPW